MENNENNNFDFESVLKALQMVESLKGTFGSFFQPNENEASIPYEANGEDEPSAEITMSTYFDEQLHTPELKAIKAAIPYLNVSVQKQLGLITKLLELKKLLSDVNSSASSYTISGFENDSERKKKMLISMRPHLQKNKQYIIDLMIKMTDMKDLMVSLQQLQNDFKE